MGEGCWLPLPFCHLPQLISYSVLWSWTFNIALIWESSLTCLSRSPLPSLTPGLRELSPCTNVGASCLSPPLLSSTPTKLSLLSTADHILPLPWWSTSVGCLLSKDWDTDLILFAAHKYLLGTGRHLALHAEPFINLSRLSFSHTGCSQLNTFLYSVAAMLLLFSLPMHFYFLEISCSVKLFPSIQADIGISEPFTQA